MKKFAKKIALVTAFVMTLGVGTTIGVNLDEIKNYSITASAEDTTYTVQDIATIENNSVFTTSYFKNCFSINMMDINQNTNVLHYIDNSKVYSYNINDGTLEVCFEFDGMSLNIDGKDMSVSEWSLYKIVSNPYNNHTYVIGELEISNDSAYIGTDNVDSIVYRGIFDIDSGMCYNVPNLFDGVHIDENYMIKYYYDNIFFYDENTMYAYIDSENVIKLDLNNISYEETTLGLMSVEKQFSNIFEYNDSFYYIDNNYYYYDYWYDYGDLPLYNVYYCGNFLNANPELILEISAENFDSWNNPTMQYCDYKKLSMFTVYNNEPYILDGTCGDIYKVNIDNKTLDKYINGADVVQTGRTCFSENICNLLMSKDGEPIIYDWKDHTIKIFKSDTVSSNQPEEPNNPSGEYSRFDVNRDDSVNILDLIELKRYILGLITE